MVKNFVNTFKALIDAVTAYYGYNIAADYVTKIKKFSCTYLDLGQKVQAVHHVQEFCALTGKGLGPCREQASDSIHHKFKQTWQLFKKMMLIMNCTVSIFWKQYWCIIATTYEHLFEFIVETILQLYVFQGSAIFVKLSFISDLCVFVSHFNL